MALKLNEKQDRPTRRAFMALAHTIGLPQGDADKAIAERIHRHANVIESVKLPGFASEFEAAVPAQGKMLALLYERCAMLARDTE